MRPTRRPAHTKIGLTPAPVSRGDASPPPPYCCPYPCPYCILITFVVGILAAFGAVQNGADGAPGAGLEAGSPGGPGATPPRCMPVKLKMNLFTLQRGRGRALRPRWGRKWEEREGGGGAPRARRRTGSCAQSRPGRARLGSAARARRARRPRARRRRARRRCGSPPPPPLPRAALPARPCRPAARAPRPGRRPAAALRRGGGGRNRQRVVVARETLGQRGTLDLRRKMPQHLGPGRGAVLHRGAQERLRARGGGTGRVSAPAHRIGAPALARDGAAARGVSD